MSASFWKGLAAILFLVCIALAVFLYPRASHEPEHTTSGPARVETVAVQPPEVVTLEEVDETIVPVEQAEPEILLPDLPEELPLAADFDQTAAAQTLLSAVGAGADGFNESNLIRRIVITIDNLPRRRLPVAYLPVQPPEQGFIVTWEEGRPALNPENYARYGSYVALLESLNNDAAVSAYVQVYPFFQSAYDELGYGARFHTRLLAVIDHLLDAPEMSGEIALAQPKVRYVFADATLEALSSGQKLMIRMGPENAARVKAALRGIRGRLVNSNVS